MVLSERLLTIFAIISLISFIIYYIFNKIRKRLPKQELCWFCHKSNKVPFINTNSWNCCHCLQYNGFKEDGDYNKLISAQFDETKNISQYCRQIRNCYSKSNELCNECNVNQEIKVKLLAEFIPFNETNFNQECDEYKKHLEKEYKLCFNCEKKVENIVLQPIKTSKELSKTPTLKSNNSVFVRQSNEKNKNKLLFTAITLLENGSLFCALLLFIIGINELQETNELTLIAFSPKLMDLLSINFVDPSLVTVIGFLVSLTAVIVSGKELLCITNVFSQLLWITYSLIYIPLSTNLIEKRDAILLRPILCFVLIILSPINTVIRFAVKTESKRPTNSLIGHKKAVTLSQGMNVGPNKGISKINCSEKNINSNASTADHIIRQQIEALCILDDTDDNRIQDFSHTERDSSASSLKSSYSFDNSFAKKIISPAKFHFESIAQTSWVSPFKPIHSISPRKESPNSTLFTNRFSSSNWINHNMTGLVTPPPSAPASICSESAFVNRFPSVNTTIKSSMPHIFDCQRNSFYNYNYNYNDSFRSRFIEKYRTNSIGLSNDESTSVSGSLSGLMINATSNECMAEKQKYSSLSANLTQTLVFAIFVLLLFCFVIFLSLPVVFKSSCDFNSFNFHFTLESVPQNNVCIK